MDAGLLLAALELASIKHRDQRRKDQAKSPYINHPIAVARLLWAHGVTDPTTILAGVLHDTIEDTATTRAELAEQFGEAVAAVVAEVTDDKSLPKARRKELQVEHAPHMSTAAKLVKLADKTSNLRDMVDSPPHDWPTERRREYFEWAERVVAGLRGVNAGLEQAFDEQRARDPNRPAG
jgi:GTP diphosphokinase / guanosine-3',5'-bis(diphosphate) 3'-diphosphatase